jgi:hypothetical protein
LDGCGNHKMPNPIEREIEKQRKITKFFNNLIFGNLENIGKPYKWYHHLNLILKILTPVGAIFFYIIKWYEVSFLLYLGFLLDYTIFLYNCKRYKEYNEYKELLSAVKIPEGQWKKKN